MLSFEWKERKNKQNQQKHQVSFELAQYAFKDPQRIIAKDIDHSEKEQRYFCFGKVNDSVLPVRFTYRAARIRISGAGYWRKGTKIYEHVNS